MANLPLRGTPELAPYEGPRLLERALAVVQFHPIAKLGEPQSAMVFDFQEEIRREYPVFEPRDAASMRVTVDPKGEVSAHQENSRTWYFATPDRGRSVTLTQGSLALEASAGEYVSRTEFIEQTMQLVNAIAKTAEPSHLARIGIRFLNTSPMTDDVDPRAHCTRELVSISSQPGLEVADLQWHFSVDEGKLILRSGFMPPKNTYDPNFFAERELPTWYLDIDVISSQVGKFVPDLIEKSLTSLIERLHATYQWAMTREGETDAATA